MSGIIKDKSPFVGPSYRLANRVLRLFGANVSMEAYVYPSTIIWAPWNLYMARQATLGPKVNCYNPAPVLLGERAVVSQGAHLCTASHDYNSPSFQLFAKAISIGSGAWIATEAFVGPGVNVGEGAVVGARAVLFRDAAPMSVWVGNPAVLKKMRPAKNESVIVSVRGLEV